MNIPSLSTPVKRRAKTKHPYTKAFLACQSLLHQKGKRLPVVSDFMEIDHAGNIVEIW